MIEFVWKSLVKELIKNAVNARILALLVNCVCNSIYFTFHDLSSIHLNSQSLTRDEKVTEEYCD